MPDAVPPIQLDNLSAKEARERLGELVQACIRQRGACVVLRRGTGQLTVLDPLVLDSVPEEDLCSFLVGSWDDEEILELLRQRARRKEVHDG